MPVPQAHKQSLDRLLNQLTDERGKKLAQHLRNPQLQAAIDELYDNPQARQEATRDPKGFFKRKGANLPDDVTVEVVQGSFCIMFKIVACIAKWCDDTGWGPC